VASEQEKAEQAALLRWLKESSAQKRAEDDEPAAMRRNLMGSGSHEFYQREFDKFAKELLPPTRKATAHDFRQAERNVTGWQSLGYDAPDVQPWLRAGIDPGEYQLVADLVAEGVTPEMLSQPFTHPRTGERVTILDVAHSFYANYRHSEFRTFCEALDDAGIERVRGVRPPRLSRRGQGA